MPSPIRCAGFAVLAGLIGLTASAPLAAPPAPKQPKGDPIQAAIKKGVAYLKQIHRPVRGYNGGSHGVGTATLAGLALLESGVAPDDPIIRQITYFARQEALHTCGTYEVSLLLMFLDRLDSKSDEALIQFLGVRLLCGQLGDGSWSYNCGNPPDAIEERRLRGILVHDIKLVAADGLDLTDPGKAPRPRRKEDVVPRDDLPLIPGAAPPKTDGPKKEGTPKAPPVEATPDPPKAPAKPELHPEVAKYLKLVNEQGVATRGSGGDHSNTQFATVGLWCARRHAVPVDKALKALDEHYRACQAGDGGWGYSGHVESSPSMTGAGLIGLAMGIGARQPVLRTEPGGDPLDKPQPQNGRPPIAAERDPAKDEAIKKGLQRLGQYLADGGDQMVIPPLPFPKDNRMQKQFKLGALHRNHYFLWSVERVGVIYGLETIGNIDWYAWGAEGLVLTQNADGSWAGGGAIGSGSDIDTPFALLFLNRANFTKDLTATLKDKVRDPGTVTLKGGTGDLQKTPGSQDSSLATDPPGANLPDPTPAVKPNVPSAARPTDFNAEADRLAAELAGAAASDRKAVLNRLRDTKGAVFTEGLLRAMPKLDGDSLKEAREALAQRLTRMTGGTLREMLADANTELRRAAALACATKGDRSHVPDLIAALEDNETLVSRAAHAALKSLTSQDFGPEADAGAAEKTKAVLAWRDWWNKNK
jgi:HEAT repeats